jgi:hypothetical protein
MPIALKTPAGGSVVLSPTNTASDATVTMPAVSATYTASAEL